MHGEVLDGNKNSSIRNTVAWIFSTQKKWRNIKILEQLLCWEINKLDGNYAKKASCKNGDLDIVFFFFFAWINTYMRQWIGSVLVLVQILACHLFGTKPLSKPMLGYWQLEPQELQWQFDKNTQEFINENASENIVCKMVAISSRGR